MPPFLYQFCFDTFKIDVIKGESLHTLQADYSYYAVVNVLSSRFRFHSINLNIPLSWFWLHVRFSIHLYLQPSVYIISVSDFLLDCDSTGKKNERNKNSIWFRFTVSAHQLEEHVSQRNEVWKCNYWRFPNWVQSIGKCNRTKRQIPELGGFYSRWQIANILMLAVLFTTCVCVLVCMSMSVCNVRVRSNSGPLFEGVQQFIFPFKRQLSLFLIFKMDRRYER